MQTILCDADQKKVEKGLRKKYGKVAITPEGSFRYPTGEDGLKGQNYGLEILENLPQDVLASYCGVGNPFSLGAVNEGESVLDIGCGAGVDTLIAGMMVGKEGWVVGIDITPEMLRRADENRTKTTFANVAFQEASGESLPFPEACFDVVISNGVFNLIPDKLKALEEAFRVLKPSGRFMIADQVLITEPSDDIESQIDNWSGWQGGAIPGKDFLAMLHEAGFIEVELVKDTGFNSSPLTKGVLFRAIKPKVQ